MQSTSDFWCKGIDRFKRNCLSYSYFLISSTSSIFDSFVLIFVNSSSSPSKSSSTCTICFSSVLFRNLNRHINGGKIIANNKEKVDTSLDFKTPVQASFKSCWTLLCATNSSWPEQFAKLKQVWPGNCVSSRVIIASVCFSFVL